MWVPALRHTAEEALRRVRDTIPVLRSVQPLSMMTIIITRFRRTHPMDDRTTATIEYGVTPTEVMASMPGIDFVRAIFDGKLPAPPALQNIGAFDIRQDRRRRQFAVEDGAD